jgi:hypothetical protein
MLNQAGSRRGFGLSVFFGAGLLAFVFLMSGLEPAYRFETELAIDNIGERCPGPAGSEASFDDDCAREVISHGPLSLAAGYLAAAFGLGVIALAGLGFVAERTRWRVAVGVIVLVYLVGWVGALNWNTREGERLIRQNVPLGGVVTSALDRTRSSSPGELRPADEPSSLARSGNWRSGHGGHGSAARRTRGAAVHGGPRDG